MIVFFAVLAAATGLGVYLTERIDRPRRAAARVAAGANRVAGAADRVA